mmetsp:Transcript_8978/g.16496  ORF Transcript_8978/g.16496 Transcript_8978/m.16496 type:complete len:321 (+) Transcript_8978:293-1255(+)
MDILEAQIRQIRGQLGSIRGSLFKQRAGAEGGGSFYLAMVREYANATKSFVKMKRKFQKIRNDCNSIVKEFLMIPEDSGKGSVSARDIFGCIKDFTQLYKRTLVVIRTREKKKRLAVINRYRRSRRKTAPNSSMIRNALSVDVSRRKQRHSHAVPSSHSTHSRTHRNLVGTPDSPKLLRRALTFTPTKESSSSISPLKSFSPSASQTMTHGSFKRNERKANTLYTAPQNKTRKNDDLTDDVIFKKPAAIAITPGRGSKAKRLVLASSPSSSSRDGDDDDPDDRRLAACSKLQQLGDSESALFYEAQKQLNMFSMSSMDTL